MRRTEENILFQHSAFTGLIAEYNCGICMNKNKEFIKKMSEVQKRAMEMISGPEKMLHRERLKELNLFSLLK